MKWLRWLSYAWSVLFVLFNVGVVLVVFSMLRSRDLSIVVAILGLIYTSVMTAIASLSLGFGQSISHLALQIHAFRKAFQPDFEPPETPEMVDGVLRKLTVKVYINMAGWAVVSLTCLFNLFTAL